MSSTNFLSVNFFHHPDRCFWCHGNGDDGNPCCVDRILRADDSLLRHGKSTSKSGIAFLLLSVYDISMQVRMTVLLLIAVINCFLPCNQRN